MMREGVKIPSGMAALTVFCSNGVKPSYPQSIASNTSLLAEISAIANSTFSVISQTARQPTRKIPATVRESLPVQHPRFPNASG